MHCYRNLFCLFSSFSLNAPSYSCNRKTFAKMRQCLNHTFFSGIPCAECPLRLEKLEMLEKLEIEPFQNLAGKAGKPQIFLLLWLEKLEFDFWA